MATTAWFQRSRYDAAAVDVGSGPAFVLAELVCWILKRSQKQYLLALRGGNLPVFAERWPGRVRRLLQSAAIVVTPSPYLLEKMRTYGGQFRLLPNPVDLAAYPYRLREHTAPRLVWLRSFHAIYNPQLAPEVVAKLAPEFPSVRLTMVGRDDGALQATKQRARELGVEDRIDFPGGVSKSQVPSWLNRGDVFLNTSDVDNTPVSVLEALACGLCVVTTNVGGIPYLLQHEHDSLMAPPNDANAMAAAVRLLLSDAELARRISSNGRAKAEQFDWASILPQWDSLLLRLTRPLPRAAAHLNSGSSR